MSFDYGTAYDRSRTVADGWVKGVHFLLKKNASTEIDGHGTFTDARTIDDALTAGGTQAVTFDDAIIATGSTVRLRPGVEPSENVTYEAQILLSRELPGSVVIVGSGAIGMEFAYVLANYGVQVTIIEYLDQAIEYRLVTQPVALGERAAAAQGPGQTATSGSHRGQEFS